MDETDHSTGEAPGGTGAGEAPGGAGADALAARAAMLERRLAELETRTRARTIEGALRTEAERAGMIDLDGLKLADASGLTVAEDGTVTGAAALVAGLRRDKPWLFGAANSSSAAPAPPSGPPQARLATEMSVEEWRAARAALLRRR